MPRERKENQNDPMEYGVNNIRQSASYGDADVRGRLNVASTISRSRAPRRKRPCLPDRG